MSDEQLRIAVSYRLGATICSSNTCWCGAKVEADGSHAFVCLRSRSCHARHHLGNEIIHKSLQSALIPAELEPAGMFRDDNKRPDGVTLMPWRLGRPMAWDFTCVHHLVASYSTQAATTGPCVAELAESRKVSKYSAISQTHFFYPFAEETLGGLSPSTLDFVNDLDRQIFLATGEKTTFGSNSANGKCCSYCWDVQKRPGPASCQWTDSSPIIGYIPICPAAPRSFLLVNSTRCCYNIVLVMWILRGWKKLYLVGYFKPSFFF